jgi:hypothetical protein
MFDGDGGETLELQAYQVAKNATMYKGSAPCPQCGIIMNPVEYMYSKGLCSPCDTARKNKRIKGKMA